MPKKTKRNKKRANPRKSRKQRFRKQMGGGELSLWDIEQLKKDAVYVLTEKSERVLLGKFVCFINGKNKNIHYFEYGVWKIAGEIEKFKSKPEYKKKEEDLYFFEFSDNKIHNLNFIEVATDEEVEEYERRIQIINETRQNLILEEKRREETKRALDEMLDKIKDSPV